VKCAGVIASLAVGALLLSAAHAAPPPIAKTEIAYLLSTVASSGCQFYRNGSWYDAKSAAAHLESKLQYLLARDLVRSSEDFIERAATQSSLSGRAYAIQCKGSDAVPAGQWLQILLARYRESVESQGKAP
jgi:Family of unknown function (DUF5329)